MLDQSFSADNFRKILDWENRKGLYLEGRFFPNLKQITEEIKLCNVEIREKKKDSNRNEIELNELYEKRELLKKNKEEQLTNELQEVSKKVVERGFEIDLKKIGIPNDKPIYTIADTPENYFAMKQIQRNVSKLFGVKQANRTAIVQQVKVLLGDRFPKYVLRTDIDDFYESIPHEPILKKINEDNLLSPFSRKILRRILDQYKAKSGTDKGIPRGIGVSAYLAELYMRDIDKAIKELSAVTYYARYVDDILIIFTHSPHDHSRDHLNDIKEIVEKKHQLRLNDAKTRPLDLRNDINVTLDYLGYRMSFGTSETKTNLTSNKVDKYKNRTDIAFTAYTNLSKINEKKARKLFIKRIRFLTGNTRLMNNKKNILVGIYYSNSQLTELDDLNALDQYLKYKIDTQISLIQVRTRLEQYSFKKGFEEKRFSSFNTLELSEIMKIWKKGS